MRLTHATITGMTIALLVGCAGSTDTTDRPAEPVTPPEPAPASDPAPPVPDRAPPPPPPPAPTADDATEPARTDAPDPTVTREVFPHVRVNIAARTVEIDGEIPIDASEAELPPVFLETVLCIAGTKDHESLIATRADASHVHAALLLIGLEPGAPGAFEWEGDQIRPIPARGDGVSVSIVTPDDRTVDVTEWIQSAEDGETLASDTRWVFAGSSFVEREDGELYAADEAGPIVGLATFGIETVAPNVTFSHETGVHEPVWVAHRGQVPPFGTRVTVIIKPVE